MEQPFSRTELLIGPEAVNCLAGARVAVIGLGGVGSFAAEALARSGVGALLLVDADVVTPSNLNRQLPATTRTMGCLKTDVMAARIAEIAPSCKVETRAVFLMPGDVPPLLDPAPDYLIDAVDTVSAKLELAVRCTELGIPVISCMGAGNKLDPTRFVLADIFSTSVCPLCRVMRRELRARGVPSLKVVYSDEPPVPSGSGASGDEPPQTGNGRRSTPGSIAFVPSVAGMIAAGAAVCDLIGRPLDFQNAKGPGKA